MHLVVVTGFLGSGKTTLAIRLAQEGISCKQKVAIVVNEIGEIGVDGELMKQLEAGVWELYSGCICCTLSADLIPTLEKLEMEYKVDVVIIEPTGVAEPENILNGLAYYKEHSLSSKRFLSVLDPLRIKEMYAVLTPLITKQVKGAEVVIINKKDIAQKEQLEKARQVIRELNSDATVWELSARGAISKEFFKEVLLWKS